MRMFWSLVIAGLLAGCGLSVPQLSDDPPGGAVNNQPFTGVTARFTNAVALDVSNKIANHCALRGQQVLRRTNQTVDCSRELKPEESVVAALHAGDKLSSPPAYRTAFALTPVGGDIVVKAQHWIEVVPRLGSRRAVGGINENDPRTNLNVFLQEIGGTPEQ